MKFNPVLTIAVSALCFLGAAFASPASAQARKSKATTSQAAPKAELFASFNRGGGERDYNLWADGTFSGAHNVKGTWKQIDDYYFLTGSAASEGMCGFIIDGVFYEVYSGGDGVPTEVTYNPEAQTFTMAGAPWLSKPRTRALSSYRDGYNRFPVTFKK